MVKRERGREVSAQSQLNRQYEEEADGHDSINSWAHRPRPNLPSSMGNRRIGSGDYDVRPRETKGGEKNVTNSNFSPTAEKWVNQPITQGNWHKGSIQADMRRGPEHWNSTDSGQTTLAPRFKSRRIGQEERDEDISQDTDSSNWDNEDTTETDFDEDKSDDLSDNK